MTEFKLRCFREAKPIHARLSWLCADLLHQADGVFFTPVFYDLPIRDPHDIDTCKAYSIARGRKSKKVADMCTSHSDARDTLIALCDQLFNFCVPVGHAKQRCLMDLLRPLQARRHSGHHPWCKNVFRNNLIERI